MFWADLIDKLIYVPQDIFAVFNDNNLILFEFRILKYAFHKLPLLPGVLEIVQVSVLPVNDDERRAAARATVSIYVHA